MRPTLSVCCITRDSSGRLEWWFERVRRYADEILVAVDAASADGTYELARRHAEVVEPVELAGHAEPAKDWLAQRASGKWILLLDDDEALSHDAAEVLPSLLADRRYDCYQLPVRWIVADAGGDQRWIRSHPWHSCHYLRLWRNQPELFCIPPRMHTTPLVAGPSRALPADGPLALYHLDLLWNSRAAREAKVTRYRRVTGADDPVCDEFYLYEDYPDLDLVPLPPGERFPVGFPARPAAATPATAPAPTPLPQLLAHAAARREAFERRTAELRRVDPAKPPWGATYRLLDAPGAFPANCGALVRVAVTNTSETVWATSGQPEGRIVLGNRWSTPGFGEEIPMGDVTLLPHPVEPGQEIVVEAGVWTPRIPGRYRLTVELLREGDAWFSQHGVAPLCLEATVTAGGAPREVRHFVGRLPDDPDDRAAARTASSLVPRPLVRVLDTRGGSALPGAVIGPLAEDGLVVLRLAGAVGIPADAVGARVTVTVIDAGYDGSLTVFPTDGTSGDTLPALRFGAGGPPASASVTCAFGVGRGHGKLSFHLSPGPTGSTAHLAVDVSGHLAPVGAGGSVSPMPGRYDVAVFPGSTYERAARMVERLAGPGLVVDLGCGFGRVAEVFSQMGRGYLGADLDAEALASLRERGHETLHLDLASDDLDVGLAAAVGERPVTAVLALDVIEHLADPDPFLDRLGRLCERWGDPLVVTSIPNVAHLDLAAKLLGGRWDYTDLGLLDRTHLSLFTEERMLASLASHGFGCVAADDVRGEAVDQRFPTGHPFLAEGTPLRHLLRWLRSLPDDTGSIYQFVRAFRRAPAAEAQPAVEGQAAPVATPPELSVVLLPRAGRMPHEGLEDTLVCLAAQDDQRFEVLLAVPADERAATEAVVDGFAPSLRDRVRLLTSERPSPAGRADEALAGAAAPLLALVTCGDVLTDGWVSAFVQGAGQHLGAVVRARCYQRHVRWTAGGMVGQTKAVPVGQERFELWQHLRSDQLPPGSFALPAALCAHAGLRLGDDSPVAVWRFTLQAAMLAGVVDLPASTCVRQRDEQEADPSDEELIRAITEIPLVFPPGAVIGLRGVHEQVAQLAASLHAAEQARAEAEQRYQDIVTSEAWRATAPIRLALGSLRARRRRPA